MPHVEPNSNHQLGVTRERVLGVEEIALLREFFDLLALWADGDNGDGTKDSD
ncbi:MAG: hypothetical protein ACREBW_10525 [Candidatus Micrarchaeaceae archaeon]